MQGHVHIALSNVTVHTCSEYRHLHLLKQMDIGHSDAIHSSLFILLPFLPLVNSTPLQYLEAMHTKYCGELGD